MAMPERRKKTRLALPKGSVSGIQGSGRILDISSAGVRIEVDTRCVFARGELHRLVLSDLLESVEVEGQVRWTRSSWRNSTPANGGEYVQQAGLAFSRLLSDKPGGIWSSLLKDMVQAPPAAAPTPLFEPPAAKAPRPTPPLEMIEPADGATIDQPSVNVVCILENPETVAGFRVNGVDAQVMGDLGTVNLKLQKGRNRILAIIYRRDGTYSTYLVGKIYRDESH